MQSSIDFAFGCTMLLFILVALVYWACEIASRKRRRWPTEQHPSYFSSQRSRRFDDLV